MLTVVLYRQTDCSKCDQVATDLADLQSEYPHALVEIDIADDQQLASRFEQKTPVVKIGPYQLSDPITRQDIKVALSAAAERDSNLSARGDEQYQARIQRGHEVNQADRAAVWLSRHYMALINFFLFLYVGLPFLAPVLANAGQTMPARFIYTIYSPLCHQLSFRSFFLFGEQTAYPLELANLDTFTSYEEAIGAGRVDLMEARRFTGNEATGYKVALCERDVAIWGGLLAFGLVFSMTGRRIRGVHWLIWVALGIMPMGIDGTSQLPALLQSFDWMPARESTPALRMITGGLFGVMTGWFLFPLIEQSMRETASIVQTKMRVISQTPARKS